MRKSRSASVVVTALLACAVPARAAHAPFTLSQPAESRALNNVWTIYGVAEAPAHAVGNATSGANPAWMEWEALKFRWTDYGGARARLLADILKVPVNGANADGRHGDGYVWSWADRETWPDEEGSGRVNHGGVPSYHYDQVPRYIIATHGAWAWSRDQAFFDAMLPRVRRVMERYLLTTMKGAGGLLVIAANDGTSTGRPSNYMDQWRAGHEDAWTNAAWFTALLCMAEMEDFGGDRERAAKYRALAARARTLYDRAFWNPATHRYAAWRDIRGVRHDAGYVMVNLEALARGLGDADKAFRVFRWLERPAAPTAGGSAAGSTDPYQNVIAPRTNTEPIPLADWDGWSNPADRKKPYGTLVEDGSTLHWLNYYDVMARLRHWDADNAWARLGRALDRYAGDPAYLTFRDRVYTVYNEDWTELLANMPENGIVPASVIDGFLGLTAGRDGLRAAPNLPMALLSVEARDVDYGGKTYTVRAARGAAVSEQAGGEAWERAASGETLAQRFAVGRPFNEVALFLRVEGKADAPVTIEVGRPGESGAPILARRLTIRPGERWQHVGLPDMAAGTVYEVRLRAPGGVSWRRDATSFWGAGAAAGAGGRALPGAFAVSAIDAPQTLLVRQEASDACDRLETTLAQSFRAEKPFDQVEVQVGTWGDQPDAGCALRLYRRVGSRWEAVTEGAFARAGDGAWLTLRFAAQPAGLYRLEMRDPSGAIGWRRSRKDVLPGPENRALTGGEAAPGDRAFRIRAGVYDISIGPDRNPPHGMGVLLTDH